MENNIKSERLERKFPNMWCHTYNYNNSYNCFNYLDGLKSFYKYITNIWFDLSTIQYHGRNEKKMFESISENKVANYIKLLSKYVYDINNIILDKNAYDEHKEKYKDNDYAFFSNLRLNLYGLLSKNACVLDEKNRIIALKDEYYKKIKPIVNKIFIMEKYCSSVCKKIWKNRLTKIEDLDLKSKYTLIVKHIYKKGWRQDRFHKEVQEFLKSKKYQSASLISNTNNSNYYNFDDAQISALLIYEPDVSKIVCAHDGDAYTEEFINEKNPCKDVDNYTNIDKIETIKRNNKNHTVYGIATKINLPNILLRNKTSFNEVLMREPKVVGVLAINKYGIDFAKKTAEEFNVKYYGVLKPRMKFEL